MLTLISARTLCALTLCALLLCALTGSVRAATLYVSPQGSDDNSGTLAAPYKTIQAAVNNASTGDTLDLAEGTYQGSGNRDIDFEEKGLSVLSSAGPGKVIIDCQGTQNESHDAFSFSSGKKEIRIVLNGLTIENSNNIGGTVSVDGRCTIKINKCTFRDNVGGSIVNNGATTLTNCTFTGNGNDSNPGCSPCIMNVGYSHPQ